MSEALYERSTELLEAELGDELMALDVARGSCFGFNPVATTIWRQLASPKSFGELRDGLLAEYDVGAEQCTDELQLLLNDLIEQRLVRVQAGARPLAPGSPEA
jgi:hypothetical protein